MQLAIENLYLLCQAINEQFNRQYASLMPTNLYGPHDNFNLKNNVLLKMIINFIVQN